MPCDIGFVTCTVPHRNRAVARPVLPAVPHRNRARREILCVAYEIAERTGTMDCHDYGAERNGVA